MNLCHYCRDAVTTTAGGRDACDDCRATYERVVRERAAATKKRLKQFDEAKILQQHGPTKRETK
jgi:hypothetical protein